MSAREDGWKARQWWIDLQPKPEFPNGRNTAALAKLRRAHSWVEAAVVPETITLFRKLEKKHESELPRVAVVAAVLAHVRREPEGDGNSKKLPLVAKVIGKAPNDSETRAILSELRLGRLLSVSGDDDILIAFRRLVALMGKSANVADLAEQILYWDHPEWGDRRRVSFAFNYWQAGDAAPPLPQATE